MALQGELVFEAVYSGNRHNVAYPVEDNADADKGGERGRRYVRVAKSETAEDGAGDAQNEQAPPHGEAHTLEIEAVDGDDDAFNHHPHGKDHRQGEGHEEIVSQEDAADDDVQDAGQHSGTAVGQERLGTEGEDEFGDTGEEGETADKPGRGEEGFGRVADADYAKSNQEGSCDAEPDFSTGFHVGFMILMLFDIVCIQR